MKGKLLKVLTVSAAFLASFSLAACKNNGKKSDSESVSEVHQHIQAIIPAVAPSCTEAGHTAGKKCADCGEILEATQVVSALGHDLVLQAAVTASAYGESGVSAYYECSRCEAKFSDAQGQNALDEIPTYVAQFTVNGTAIAPNADGTFSFAKVLNQWNSVEFKYTSLAGESKTVWYDNTTVSGKVTAANAYDADWTDTLYHEKNSDGSEKKAWYCCTTNRLAYTFEFNPTANTLVVGTAKFTLGGTHELECEKADANGNLVIAVDTSTWNKLIPSFNGKQLWYDNTTVSGKVVSATATGADWTENLYHEDNTGWYTCKGGRYVLTYNVANNTLNVKQFYTGLYINGTKAYTLTADGKYVHEAALNLGDKISFVLHDNDGNAVTVWYDTFEVTGDVTPANALHTNWTNKLYHGTAAEWICGVSTKAQYKFELDTTAKTLKVTCHEHLGSNADTRTVTEKVVAADCTHDGSHEVVVYCNVCDEEISRTKVTDAKLGHTPLEAVNENVVAADCTHDGSHDEVVYCDVCGDKVSTKHVVDPALGHKPGEAVAENVQGATHDVAGTYDSVVYCTVCHEELSRTTVEGEVLPYTAEEVFDNIVDFLGDVDYADLEATLKDWVLDSFVDIFNEFREIAANDPDYGAAYKDIQDLVYKFHDNHMVDWNVADAFDNVADAIEEYVYNKVDFDKLVDELKQFVLDHEADYDVDDLARKAIDFYNDNIGDFEAQEFIADGKKLVNDFIADIDCQDLFNQAKDLLDEYKDEVTDFAHFVLELTLEDAEDLLEENDIDYDFDELLDYVASMFELDEETIRDNYNDPEFRTKSVADFLGEWLDSSAEEIRNLVDAFLA